METKNIVIIAVLAITICIIAGATFGLLTKSVNYERIELMPNGTSIEAPANELKYEGEVNESGAKLWTFKQGSLMTFNSEEAINARGLYGLGGAVGIKAINDMVLNHFEKREEIDGFTVYTIDGEKLGIEGRGIMYCIITKNDDTHDNIVIITDSKDITLHMAKSIQYKSANITNTNSNEASTASTSTHNTTDNNKNKYSEEDLARANQEGYDSGYSDGYSDSYYDDYDDDYSFETTTSRPSSSSSSSSSHVETSAEGGYSVETTLG